MLAVIYYPKIGIFHFKILRYSENFYENLDNIKLIASSHCRMHIKVWKKFISYYFSNSLKNNCHYKCHVNPGAVYKVNMPEPKQSKGTLWEIITKISYDMDWRNKWLFKQNF